MVHIVKFVLHVITNKPNLLDLFALSMRYFRYLPVHYVQMQVVGATF